MLSYLFVAAAHCIQAARLVRDGFVPDYVRLGEHDLRSDKDCEEVSARLILIFY